MTYDRIFESVGNNYFYLKNMSHTSYKCAVQIYMTIIRFRVVGSYNIIHYCIDYAYYKLYIYV